MNRIFVDDSLEHWNYWIQEDKKKAKKIYELIKDIERNGAAKGKGIVRLGVEKLMTKIDWFMMYQKIIYISMLAKGIMATNDKE